MKYIAFARRYKRGPLNNRRMSKPPIEPEPPPKNKEPPDKKKYRPTRHNKEYLQKRVNAIAKMLIKRSPAPLIAGGRRRIINEHHIYAREHYRSTHYYRRGPRASFRRRQYHHNTPYKTQPTAKPTTYRGVYPGAFPTHIKVNQNLDPIIVESIQPPLPRWIPNLYEYINGLAMTFTAVNCKQPHYESPKQNCNLQPIYHPSFTLSEYSNLLSTLYDINEEDDNDNEIPSLIGQCESSDDESDNEFNRYIDTHYYFNFSNNAINDKSTNDDDQVGKTSSSTTSSAICGVY